MNKSRKTSKYDLGTLQAFSYQYVTKKTHLISQQKQMLWVLKRTVSMMGKKMFTIFSSKNRFIKTITANPQHQEGELNQTNMAQKKRGL